MIFLNIFNVYKTKTILTILTLLFTFSTTHLTAQVIIEESDENTFSKDYWDKTFKAGIGSAYAYGLDGRSSRAYSYARLNWSDDFDWIRFAFEGLFYKRDFRYVLTLNAKENANLDDEIIATRVEHDGRMVMQNFPTTQEACDNKLENTNSDRQQQLKDRLEQFCRQRNQQNNEQRINLQIENSEFLWREANATVQLKDNLELLVGWHTIVWGQLDFLSPVDFILPFRLGSTGLGLTKADNRNPQKTAILYYFPTTWIEFQAYFFPDLGIDQAFLDNIEQENETRNEDYKNIAPTDIPKGKDAYRYASRILFYLDDLILGFVYYRGFFQFDADENKTLIETTNDQNKTIYRIDGNPKLQTINAWGFESALARKKWTWKMDGIFFETKEDLDLDVQTFNNQNLGFVQKDKFFDKRSRYIEWVLNKNNGDLEITNQVYIVTVGVDANLDKWLLNLGILMFYFPNSKKDQEGNKLYTEAEDVDDGPFGGGGSSNFFPAPTINVARYLDNDKKDALGVAMGFLNSGGGLILYASHEFFESLRTAISFEYLFLFSNGLVDVEGYELENPSYPAIRLIMDYQF